MGRRRAAIVLLALALVATACGGDDSKDKKASEGATAQGPTGPQSYTVEVDAPSPEGGNLQFSAFFPAKLVVRPGDTVIFDNRSTQAPHTVTFGAKAFAPEAPFPATKAGLANPVVFGPCYTDALPPPVSEACPAPPPATPPSSGVPGCGTRALSCPSVAHRERPPRSRWRWRLRPAATASPACCTAS